MRSNNGMTFNDIKFVRLWALKTAEYIILIAFFCNVSKELKCDEYVKP